MFFDRKRELAVLLERLRSDRFELVVVYGRRRVGKSALVLEALNRMRSASSIYYLATESGNLIDFKRTAEVEVPDIGKLKEDWEAYLEALKGKILVFDEFPNMILENRNITSLFQRSVDTKLKGSRTKLVLLGSSISMMESMVLGHKSPLYGRKTSALRLGALDIFSIWNFFPKAKLKEVIEISGFAGGVPYYLEKVEVPFWAWLEKELLKPDTFIKTEVDFLLKYEFDDLRTYKRILEAIAFGKTKLTDINDYVKPKGQLTSYLANLIKVDLVERRAPIFSNAKSKQGRYYIKDNFISFWFRFIAPNLSLIEAGIFKIKHVKDEYSQYMGGIFERTAEELVMELVRKGRIFECTSIGKYWGRRSDKSPSESAFDIDTIAANKETSEIAFIEVKWSDLDEKAAMGIIGELMEKSGFVDWRNGSRKERYGIIARSVEGKERLRKSGYFVYDIADFQNM
jgi:hypothetical protein